HRTEVSGTNRRVGWQRCKAPGPRAGATSNGTIFSTAPEPEPRKSPSAAKALRSCPECGRTITPDAKRRYPKFCSDACARAADPAHSAEAARKRAETSRRRTAEREEWERTHPDVDVAAERVRFAQEIAPRLATIPLKKIVEATGMSPTYAQFTRRGARAPHPMFYAALEALVEECAPGRNE